MTSGEHHMAHKAAEMLVGTGPGQAAVGASAGLLLAATPIVAPAVVVVAAGAAVTAAATWGICKLVEWAQSV